MSNLSKKLKSKGIKINKPSKEPVWKGPEVDGITQSMLSRFLVCRERFRLYAIEGLRTADAFNHRIEYGQMWHACEEALAGTSTLDPKMVAPFKAEWEIPLKEYCQGLVKRYPLSQEQILHWYNVCKVQFPLYVEYWRANPDVTTRTPLLQEQVFDVPYLLPSGREVRLRGKWDAVDLIGKGKGAGIYLQENKSKGDIDETQIKRQLVFDLQTLFYLVALTEWKKQRDNSKSRVGLDAPILGVRYNVAKRPLSGGKGSIVRHKPSKSNPNGESAEDFYARLGGMISEQPQDFFMRWKAEISPQDIEKFKREFLTPILEQLCDWYDWIECCRRSSHDPFDQSEMDQVVHWRHPFGVYNPMDSGADSDLDEYLSSKSEAGLRRVDKLFTELE